jgi:hypothetical protein
MLRDYRGLLPSPKRVMWSKEICGVLKLAAGSYATRFSS